MRSDWLGVQQMHAVHNLALWFPFPLACPLLPTRFVVAK